MKAVSGSGDKAPKQADSARQAFQKLLNSKRLTFQAFDTFPIPVLIFNAGGAVVFANRAMLELNGIEDPGLIAGKYNLLEDRESIDLLEHRESLERVFRGEALTIQDFRPPIQDLVKRGMLRRKPFESALMEAHFSPIKDKGSLVFVVCAFVVKSIYRGKPEVARAKEYLSLNWRGKFDSEATAQALNMSVAQLYRLFKQHTNMTPGEYHLQCKIEHIKEKLGDMSLTVKEALEACGENSGGWILKVFKKVTGVTPGEYRMRNMV